MRLKTRVVAILLMCCLLIASMLFYFIVFFDDFESNSPKEVKHKSLIIVPFTELMAKNSTKKSMSSRVRKKIENKLQSLDFGSVVDKDLEVMAKSLVESLKSDISLNTDSGQQSPWLLAESWVTARSVLPQRAPFLGHVLTALQTRKIIGADVAKRGTQLKVMLELEGRQRALFKPMRYAREYVADGLYAGADRHNGEILAFHLSRLLDMRFAPIVASRVVHVSRDIRSVSSAALSATFVNRTADCFYGECYYCSSADAVCPEPNGLLEGAVILLLPAKYQLQKIRNPWQRTYKTEVPAIWESDMDFCDNVVSKRVALRPRLLDLMDVSIFDYLIGNADRHHLEVFKDVPNSALLLIDNGKSFGDPMADEITIAYPLYQCCVVRNSTYQRLRLWSAFGLSRAVEALLSEDVLWPLVTRAHLDALDRRLRTVVAIIGVCLDAKNEKQVLK